MKTFSVAVAVAVVLTIICIQESSALPLSEVADFEVPVYVDSPAEAAAVGEEASVESWKMPYSSRSKRSPAGCRFCCGCCPNMSGCGVCCTF